MELYLRGEDQNDNQQHGWKHKLTAQVKISLQNNW